MMGRNMYRKHFEQDQEDIVYHQGCFSGVIRAFDYHQWNYIRRISHEKHKGSTYSDGTGNLHTTLLDNQELEQVFGNNESQYHAANKRSLKSRIKVFSKLRKGKTHDSGFSSRRQLQRTYSLHRLEPSDRRLDEIWQQKISEIVFIPDNLDSENKSSGSLQINQLDKVEDTCELVEGETESFQEITGNGDYGTKMFLDMHPNFSIKARFTKSGSFPTTDMSRKMNFTTSKLESKINETWVSSEGGLQSVNNRKFKKHFRTKSWNLTSDTEEMLIDKKLGEPFQSLKAESKNEDNNEKINLPENILQTIHHERADKNETSTISFDKTFLLDEHPRESDNEKDSRCCTVVDENSDIRRDFIHRKSYSLSDSLERYSRLVEFSSRTNIKLQSSKSLKLRNEYDPPSTSNSIFRRIYSLSHLDSFHSIQKEEQGNAQLGSLPLETVLENDSFVEGDTNGEEIQNERVEGMGDAVILAGENTIYIGDLEESSDNKIIPRIKEEDAHCSENTDEFSPLPTQDSDAETFEGKNFEKANENDFDLCYVRELLARSTFCKYVTNEIWLSDKDLLMNKYIFEETEADWHQELESEKDSMYGHSTHHQVLFDVVNEAIVQLHDRTSLCYPRTLSCSCLVHHMPIGRRIDEEILGITSSFLSRKAKQNQSVDDIVHGDMERDDGWMKLDSEIECLAMELEDIIADELLDELLFGELLELH